ncbi:hypothetical protein ACLOJK_040312 [Asimina triloba]
MTPQDITIGHQAADRNRSWLQLEHLEGCPQEKDESNIYRRPISLWYDQYSESQENRNEFHGVCEESEESEES